jgi:hypothetical protein
VVDDLVKEHRLVGTCLEIELRVFQTRQQLVNTRRRADDGTGERRGMRLSIVVSSSRKLLMASLGGQLWSTVDPGEIDGRVVLLGGGW